ncbi:hypothetical protein Y032_0018g3536 [Ancylostoma ceylanicum]|uniref:Uncharacterized protein n=1 Tax=Ancylostoma ceylanicum TaxID=53326 RepID=A0A016V457_9BILA|nr:hypothetical protein Y032_0018g3536 [Ancylostoma ceylanicum]
MSEPTNHRNRLRRDAVKTYAATRPHRTRMIIKSSSFKFDTWNDISGHLLTVFRLRQHSSIPTNLRKLVYFPSALLQHLKAAAATRTWIGQSQPSSAEPGHCRARIQKTITKRIDKSNCDWLSYRLRSAG